MDTKDNLISIGDTLKEFRTDLSRLIELNKKLIDLTEESKIIQGEGKKSNLIMRAEILDEYLRDYSLFYDDLSISLLKLKMTAKDLLEHLESNNLGAVKDRLVKKPHWSESIE